MWKYSDIVLKNFINPKNVGEIKNSDGEATVGSLVCGDSIKLSFKLDNSKKIIKYIKFKTFGCASAIASSSMLTQIVKGKTLEEAERITNKYIIKQLGGLPKEKIHCSVMCEEALKSAINNYYDKCKIPNSKKIKKIDQSEIICNCFNITKQEIIDLIRINDLHSVEEITKRCNAGSACKKCISKIKKILVNELI